MDIGALYTLLMVGAGLAAPNSITEFSKGPGKSLFDRLKSRIDFLGGKTVAMIDHVADNPALEGAILADLGKPAIATDAEVERLALELQAAIDALPEAEKAPYAVKIHEIHSKRNLTFRDVEGVLSSDVIYENDVTFEELRAEAELLCERWSDTNIGHTEICLDVNRVKYAKTHSSYISNQRGRYLHQKKGRIYFRVPRRMWKNIREKVELRIYSHEIISDFERQRLLETFQSRGGKIEEDVIERIGCKMSAELLADENFLKIIPLNSEDQDFILRGKSMLRWDWMVIPLRKGRATVRINVKVKVDSLGRELNFDTSSFDRSIEISIQSASTEIRRFFRDNWRWVLTTGGGFGALATFFSWMWPTIGRLIK